MVLVVVRLVQELVVAEVVEVLDFLLVVILHLLAELGQLYLLQQPLFQ